MSAVGLLDFRAGRSVVMACRFSEVITLTHLVWPCGNKGKHDVKFT